jgi:hypothetical protein
LLDAGHWHATADRVGLLAMTGFLNHASAADIAGFGAWHPFSAADGTESLASTATSGAGAGTWSRTAWITRNLLCLGHPITGANLNLTSFGHWFADGVADVFVASFRFGAVAGAADFAALGFVNWLADRTADIAVARLEARLTDGAADIAVAGLVARLTNRAADIAVARLEARLTDGAADITVARLIARLANRIAFVAVAGLVDVTSAAHGNLLAALFVDGATAIVGLLFPDGLTNRLVTSSAALLGGAVRTAGIAGGRRTAPGTGGTTVKGICL